jgi:TonB-linked SusC/RagA family outer membrane protein
MKHGGVTVLASALAISAATAFAQGSAQQAEPATPAPAQAPPSPAAAEPKKGRTLSGVVLDAETRAGIPLATVMVKADPPIRIETDADGRFTAQGLPEGPLTVRGFSADYLPLDVTVPAGQNTVTIALRTYGYLEEVLVVGRATEAQRRHLANSVASVSARELYQTPSQTVDQALQGKVAGANIQSNAGAPGGGLQLRLRGVSTINGRSEPLYVVDGVLVSDVAISNGINAVTRSNAGSNPAPTQDGQVNRIADINPDDIQNVEILKGASAAAIYGSKASNGVVIISTKRGAAGGQPRMNFTQRVGMSQLANKLGARRFNSVEDAEEVFGEQAASHFQGYFDHEEELAGRAAPATESVLSLSGTTGGRGETRYFASGTMRNDEGIIQNTGYQRQGLRLNLDHRFGDVLDLRISSNLLHTQARRGIFNNDNSGTSHYMILSVTPSFIDLRRRPDGSYPENPFIASHANPLQTAALMKNDEDVWRLLGSVDGSLQLWRTDAQDLKLTGVIGVDRFQQKNALFFPPELFFEPLDDQLAGTSLDNSSENLNVNGGINLVHTLRGEGTFSRLTSSIGFQQEERRLDTLYVISENQNAGQENVDTGTQVSIAQRRELVRDRGLYLQEEALLLDERLSLTAAVRAEQSSVIGPYLRFFFYPKAGAAYRIPELPTAIEELKVRVAYGETGNLPLYGQKFTALVPNRNISGNPGLITTGIAGDPKIVPERQREIEAGVDLVAFNGDGLLELTVYQRDISDLLLQRTLAPSTGYLTQFLNGGGLRNRGVELMLQVVPVKSGRFEWSSRVGFALNRSEITTLSGEPAFNTGGFGVALGAFRIEEGASATQIVGNDGPKPDGSCCVVRKLGDTEPTFRTFFLNGVSWGPLRANLLLDWQQGSSIINLTRFLYDLVANTSDWQAGEQRLAEFSQNFRTAVYIEDATFVKLRELTLTYELPASLWSRAFPGLKTARLSVSGRNLLTFTGYSGLDPEVSNFGNQPIARNIDVAPFPPSRSYWASIELGF